MAHQTANVDHMMGWELQEDLLQDIHRGCKELKGRRFGKSAFNAGIGHLETKQELNIVIQYEIGTMCVNIEYCRETWPVTQ